MGEFHINAEGKARKCSSAESICPYGDEEEHYSSRKYAEAAVSWSSDSTSAKSPFADVRVKRSDRLRVAMYSDNPDELMAVAKVANRKIALALALNPNVPGSVLMEARANTSLTYYEFVRLEHHPNYPLSAMTRTGAYSFVSKTEPSKVREVMERDDVSDALITQAGYSEDDNGEDYGVREALRNPNNRVSATTRGTMAHDKDSYLRAAAESGKFPSAKDIANGARYYNKKRMRFGPLSDEVILKVARYTPSQENAENLYDEHSTTPFRASMIEAIRENSNLPESFKQGLFED